MCASRQYLVSNPENVGLQPEFQFTQFETRCTFSLQSRDSRNSAQTKLTRYSSGEIGGGSILFLKNRNSDSSVLCESWFTVPVLGEYTHL